ncbi:MAG: hypothetical protein KH758_10120, partial [[Ruminococcus] lactaris]|nr:hypothetical protein [[Ruminococcus] lactaris]
MKKYSRVCAYIDLDAIAYNMEQMKKRIGEDGKLMQGNVYPKLPAPCRRQTDTACLHDARHENYRIP